MWGSAALRHRHTVHRYAVAVRRSNAYQCVSMIRNPRTVAMSASPDNVTPERSKAMVNLHRNIYPTSLGYHKNTTNATLYLYDTYLGKGGAPVNEKQKRFCDEYLIDLNASQAYIRAGYAPKNAHSQASRLLANVSVRARIDRALAERSARTGVTADRVVRELARLAFADITQVVDVDQATVLPDVSEDDRATIASVKVKSSPDFTEREIKGWDKLKALELLGKHMGMFTSKADQQTGKLSEILEAVRAIE